MTVQPKGRKCARCLGPISETRPVFLIALTDGNVLGPFHAGCAERLKILVAGKTRELPSWADADLFGRWVRREETLP